MKIKFRYSPCELYRDFRGSELKNRLVLIDIQPDIVPKREIDKRCVLRINLDVVFNDVLFRRMNKTFHYAVPGATIIIDILTGTILRDFTPDVTLGVNYKNVEQHHQAADVSFVPAISVAAGNTGGSIRGPGAKVSAGSTRAFDSEFSGAERVLTSQYLPPSQLEWQIRPVRGEKVVSDFVHGNLYLFFSAACDEVLEGKVSVIPDRIAYYDSRRREITGMWNEIGMWILTSKFRSSIKNRDGIKLEFEVTPHD